MDNRELYIKAVNLIGKEQMEAKQKEFLLRVISKAEQKAQNLSSSELKKKKALVILQDLNHVCMTHFRDTDNNLALIYARLAENFTVEDFQLVHRIKAGQWLESVEFRKYLCPQTLYSTRHFEQYLNEALTKQSIKKNVVVRKWQDYTTLQELVDNRIGLDIPDEIKRLYGFYSVVKDHKDYEAMEKVNQKYKELLEGINEPKRL